MQAEPTDSSGVQPDESADDAGVRFHNARDRTAAVGVVHVSFVISDESARFTARTSGKSGSGQRTRTLREQEHALSLYRAVRQVIAEVVRRARTRRGRCGKRHFVQLRVHGRNIPDESADRRRGFVSEHQIRIDFEFNAAHIGVIAHRTDDRARISGVHLDPRRRVSALDGHCADRRIAAQNTRQKSGASVSVVSLNVDRIRAVACGNGHVLNAAAFHIAADEPDALRAFGDHSDSRAGRYRRTEESAAVKRKFRHPFYRNIRIRRVLALSRDQTDVIAADLYVRVIERKVPYFAAADPCEQAVTFAVERAHRHTLNGVTAAFQNTVEAVTHIRLNGRSVHVLGVLFPFSVHVAYRFPCGRTSRRIVRRAGRGQFLQIVRTRRQLEHGLAVIRRVIRRQQSASFLEHRREVLVFVEQNELTRNGDTHARIVVVLPERFDMSDLLNVFDNIPCVRRSGIFRGVLRRIGLVNGVFADDVCIDRSA